MHRATNSRPYTRTLRRIAGTTMHIVVTVTVAALAVMEKLVTGRFGALVGAERVLRLFGGIEPLPSLVHCTIAMRSTEKGDDFFLSFELHPLMLDDHEVPTEFTVQVIRAPREEGWQGVQRSEFGDATAALFEFCYGSSLQMRLD